jgi:hypothetical protein
MPTGRIPIRLLNAVVLVLVASLPASAEVMDKEPSQLAIWSWSIVAAGIGYGLCRLRPWLAFITLPLALSFIALILLELADPHVGPAILREAGWPYLAGLGGGTILIVLAHTVGIVSHHHRRA